MPTGLLAAVREQRPDVAIVDIRMPPTHTDEGVRATEAIRDEHGTAVGVLVLSQYVETSLALRLVSDGSGGVGTCSRTGSTTSTSSRTRSGGSRRAAR